MARRKAGRPKGRKTRKGTKKTAKTRVRRSRRMKKTGSLAAYLKAGRKKGWNMGRWSKALKTTRSCAAKARKVKTPVGRMLAFNRCRSAKKLPKRKVSRTRRVRRR